MADTVVGGRIPCMRVSCCTGGCGREWMGVMVQLVYDLRASYYTVYAVKVCTRVRSDQSGGLRGNGTSPKVDLSLPVALTYCVRCWVASGSERRNDKEEAFRPNA